MALNGLIDNEAYAPAAICSRGPPAKSSTTAARSRTIRIPWRLRDLYAAGMKIQSERQQNRQALLSDRDLPTNSRFAQSAGLPPFRAMEPARSSTYLPALGSQQARGRRMNTWTG